MKIISFIKNQHKDYNQYREQFVESTIVIQSKTLLFIGVFFLINTLINSAYDLFDFSRVTSHNYLKLGYGLYFVVAAMILKYFIGKKSKYIMWFIYFNVVVLLLFLAVSRFFNDYYISFALMTVIVIVPALTIYGSYLNFGLILFCCLFFDYIVAISMSGRFQISILGSIYYILEAFIVFIIASTIHIFFFRVKYNKVFQLNHLKRERDIDGLTGLLNRAAAERYVARFNNNKNLHGMIVMDLDNFKMINDSMGHLAGDKTLIAVTEILNESFRNTDCIARYGGDEFIVFIPNIDNKSTLRQKANECLDKCQKSQLGRDGIAVSLGIAAQNGGSEGALFKELFDKADQDMYQNKKRNKLQ